MPRIPVIISAVALLGVLAGAFMFANATVLTSGAALPSINYVPQCELAGKFVGLQKSSEQAGKEATQACVEDEKDAQEWLSTEWDGLAPKMKSECLDHVQSTQKGLQYSWIMNCVLDRSDG